MPLSLEIFLGCNYKHKGLYKQSLKQASWHCDAYNHNVYKVLPQQGKREWASRRKVTVLSQKRHPRAWKGSLVNLQSSSQDENDHKSK